MLSSLTNFAIGCDTFLGIPPWYEYVSGPGCGEVEINSLNDIWLIGLGVVEILLSVATLAAIIYFLFGTIQLIVARGNPESIASARSSMTNALIGLAIALLSTTLVSFIAGRLA